MVDLILSKGGSALVTSKQLAEHFGKAHRRVLQDISVLGCSEEFREHNFVPSSYVSLQSKTLKCYDITRDGFSMLAMGFTGKTSTKWKEKYIKAFNLMESELNKRADHMDQLNELVLRIEKSKEGASCAAKELQSYRKTKADQADELNKALDRIQLSLFN